MSSGPVKVIECLMELMLCVVEVIMYSLACEYFHMSWYTVFVPY